ncbi:hypothetical protein JR316_0008283 [Psilocybe cubensis]|uniref:Uncharacterized protein n=2 Tax=Psilocybe cubensis TaxID=181762 RepID=A0ACB8GVC0_PSICU|nr:hypothetical protein JR316_0008283 [Psilocybe cubensis]KAH9479688.1 hypothetical protein JR316_0008283 [Psilocybe cubensis]
MPSVCVEIGMRWAATGEVMEDISISQPHIDFNIPHIASLKSPKPPHDSQDLYSFDLMSATTSASATTTGNVNPINYGVARPSMASTPLWENLLHSSRRAPTSVSDIAYMAPPSAPMDKNATSMRVLLHDTQANFEKFGKHVGQLFEEIKESKAEIKSIHSLFDKDRESLMGDIVDLVNRSQKEIQKSVGVPAQDTMVEQLFKDVNYRLSGLDQRLDAIQSFNQAHTQALQTQIQAVQILLDKQATIMAAVLPLLPLLQAIPLHIDALKTNLTETLSNFVTSYKFPATIQEPALNNLGKRIRVESDKPPQSVSTTPSMSTPVHKKARIDKLPSKSPSKHASVSEIANPSSSPIQRAPLASIRRISTRSHTSSRGNDQKVGPSNGLSPTNLADRTTPLSSGRRRGTFAVPAFTTPRRPLGDLPVSSPRVTSKNLHRRSSVFRLTGTHDLASESSSDMLPPVFSMVNLTGLTSTEARPPRILHAQTSFSSAGGMMAASGDADIVSASRDERSLRDPRIPVNTPTLQRQSFNVKKESVEDVHTLGTGHMEPPTLASAGLEILAGKPKGMFNKARRSPTREGRRFIPLVDSDESEDDGVK